MQPNFVWTKASVQFPEKIGTHILNGMQMTTFIIRLCAKPSKMKQSKPVYQMLGNSIQFVMDWWELDGMGLIRPHRTILEKSVRTTTTRTRCHRLCTQFYARICACTHLYTFTHPRNLFHPTVFWLWQRSYTKEQQHQPCFDGWLINISRACQSYWYKYHQGAHTEYLRDISECTAGYDWYFQKVCTRMPATACPF